MADYEDGVVLVEEDGDYFEVCWKESIPATMRDGFVTKYSKQNFIFQRDKDEFVTNLLTNDKVYSIEVGTFIIIK